MFKNLIAKLPELKKFIVAALGLALQAVNAGYVHGSLAHYVAVVAAALTALGVYTVKNKVKAPTK